MTILVNSGATQPTKTSLAKRERFAALAEAQKEVAYMFGTFNPVTGSLDGSVKAGHLDLARQVKEQYGFKKIVFVPPPSPPHKKDVAEFSHRVAMLRAAIGSTPGYEVSEIEAEIARDNPPNFTYKTLERLGAPTSPFKLPFIAGADVINDLETKWKFPEKIVSWLHFLISPRDNQPVPQQITVGGTFYPITSEPVAFNAPMSSTEIRNKAKAGESLKGLVHPAVEAYIQQHQLYQN